MTPQTELGEQEKAAIKAELDRILASKLFINAKRLRSMLSYVVGESLQGRGDRIKAFSIAQEVFGRNADFDQQRDPIVRVEASRLRKCLSEYYETDGSASRVRIDIPKGGYAPTFSYKPSRTEQLRRGPLKKLTYVILAIVALGVVFWLGDEWGGQSTEPPLQRESVFLVVLPLGHNAESIEASSVANSFVDSTITLLARLPDVSVMAHASMLEAERTDLTIRELKEAYKVTHVLRGSIEIHGDDLRILTQLIDTSNSETVWSERLEGSVEDIWTIQDELARRVISALEIEAASTGSPILAGRYTENLEALTLYRQGLLLILPPNEKARVNAAKQLFTRVRELDPEFAGGYAGASWTHSLPVLFQTTQSRKNDLDAAVTYAEEAIARDDSFGASHVVLGFAQSLQGSRTPALENVRLAAAIQPGDAFVQFLTGVTFVLSGLPEESFAPINEAIRLNPVEKRTPYINVYGIARFANQEYELALAAFDRNDSRDGPQGPHMLVFRALSLTALGREKEAEAIAGVLREQFPSYPYQGWLQTWLGQSKHLDQVLQYLTDLGLTETQNISS